MSGEISVLRMRVLLSFYNENSEVCTVTGLAKTLNEGKQKISRQITALAEDGLIDKSDSRHPFITEAGRKQAEYYQERYTIALNHMLYEGLDLKTAQHDANVWAAFNSDEMMQVIRNSEQIYHAKYELRKRKEFNGDVFCKYLSDGDYSFPFLFYREEVSNGNNLSMANEGFEHPCTLKVKNGKGVVCLKAVRMTAKSSKTGKEMQGILIELEYLSNGKFIKVEEKSGGRFMIPADALHILSMGEGIGQILHGSVCLKMKCSVGTAHMPESTAVFTIIM